MRIVKWMLTAMTLVVGGAQAGTVVVSGGTSMIQAVASEEHRLSSLQVACESVNRTNVGYQCGFDDGQHTVLQFEERSDGQVVRFFDAENKEIVGARHVGKYYVLPQLYPMVFARVAGKEAVLLRSNDKNVLEAGQGGAAATPLAAGSRSVSGVMVGAVSTAPAAPVIPRVAMVHEGERYDLALKAAAAAEGWKFKWYVRTVWTAPGDIDLLHDPDGKPYKDVSEAIVDIVDGLHREGRPVKWRISEGNKMIEILSTGVRND